METTVVSMSWQEESTVFMLVLSTEVNIGQFNKNIISGCYLVSQNMFYSTIFSATHVTIV